MDTQENWTEDEIKLLVKETTNAVGVKGKDLYFPLRLALFGEVHGPDIPALIDILGTQEAITRFEKIKKYFGSLMHRIGDKDIR